MTPKLSNLDIPEIKAAAAEWALASSQIEKITLHRFKPAKIQREEGPFYAIIIWVASEIDVNIAPWMELSKRRVGMDKLYKEQVRKQYITQDGTLDEEQVSKHPMYGLWNLFWKLSAKESKEREGFYCFYRDGFERSDPRFDWLVLLFNIGDEDIFEHATKDETIYDELDNTETGRAVLFSRKAEVPQVDATQTQTPVSVESCVPETKDLVFTKGKAKTWNELLTPGYHLGQYFVTQLGIKGFELFDLMKKGLQAYTSTGKKVVDSDSLSRGKRKSLEQVEANQRAKQNARVIGALGGSVGGPCSEYDIKKSAQRIYNSQSLEILNPPKSCELMSFTLPNNDDTANEVISKVLCFQFRSVDVVKFANEYRKIHSLPPEETQVESTDPSALSQVNRLDITKEPQQTQGVPANQSATPNSSTSDGAASIEHAGAEAFMDSLSVAYLSNTEVSIKVGNNKPNSYTCGKIGFKSAENGWKLLMEVFKDRDHVFNVGTYSKDRIPEKNKRYNLRQKWIPQFTKKFITFLNSEYPVRIPDKMKLLENQKKKDRDGLYKPIFHIVSSDTINSNDMKNMSKQVILKEIEELVNDRKRVKNEDAREALISRIGHYATHAYKNRWITQEQLQKMISLPDEEVPGSPDDALSSLGESNNSNDF